MGPTWVLSAPDGTDIGPMNLAIRVGYVHWHACQRRCWMVACFQYWLSFHVSDSRLFYRWLNLITVVCDFRRCCAGVHYKFHYALIKYQGCSHWHSTTGLWFDAMLSKSLMYYFPNLFQLGLIYLLLQCMPLYMHMVLFYFAALCLYDQFIMDSCDPLTYIHLGPHLLTWFSFNPSTDK